MMIREIKLSELSRLTYRTFVCEFGGKWHPKALILEFSGEYGSGSAGNDDADIIAVIRSGAIEYVDPKAVVFDFRNMRYEWGNRIWNVLRCRRHDSDYDDYLPTAMVVSELCRPGFSTCAGFVPPMFDQLEEALAFVETPVRKYVDELMADVE
jgi:hypothetical protein